MKKRKINNNEKKVNEKINDEDTDDEDEDVKKLKEDDEEEDEEDEEEEDQDKEDEDKQDDNVKEEDDDEEEEDEEDEEDEDDKDNEEELEAKEREQELKRIQGENRKYYPHFKIGNSVYARWSNGLLYPGKIVGLYESRVVALIKWEHKEKYENTKVHRDDIYPHVELKVGMEVSAIYNGPDEGNGHSFKAKIASFAKNNMVLVDWDDGGKDYRKIHTSLISPLEIPEQKKRDLKRGDTVMARWYGQDNGYMYPAKVVSIKDDIVVVNWLDGGVTNREVNIKHVVYKHDV